MKDFWPASGFALALLALIGLIWTYGYLQTVPGGSPPGGPPRLESLAPIVACAGLYGLTILALTLGYPGTIYRLAARRFGAELYEETLRPTAPWLFGSLAVTSFVFLLLAYLGQTHKWPIPQWLVLLSPPIAVIIAHVHASRSLPWKRVFRFVSAPSIFASFFWLLTIVIVGQLDVTLAQSNNWSSNAFWTWCYMATFTLGAGSAALLSSKDWRMGAVMGAFILFIFAVQDPRDLLSMPFRQLHLADYSVTLVVTPATDRGLMQLSQQCPKIRKISQYEYAVDVIASIGQTDVLKCSATQPWIRLTRNDAWFELASAPAANVHP
jgi:hypothetical protein